MEFFFQLAYRGMLFTTYFHDIFSGSHGLLTPPSISFTDSQLATRLDNPNYFTLAHSHAHFDMMGPIGPVCKNLVRIVGKGWGNDNAKYVCGLPSARALAPALLSAAAEAAAAEEDCVIYSIGSHGEWGFEYGTHRDAPRARSRIS